MEERPDAEIHADQIDVLVTEDGKFAVLHIFNESGSISASIPRRPLLAFMRSALMQLELTRPSDS
jgi:hypothetical protein